MLSKNGLQITGALPVLLVLEFSTELWLCIMSNHELNLKGMPSACEADVMGALTMYSQCLASGKPSSYLDWNNNYNDERTNASILIAPAFRPVFAGDFVPILMSRVIH